MPEQWAVGFPRRVVLDQPDTMSKLGILKPENEEGVLIIVGWGGFSVWISKV